MMSTLPVSTSDLCPLTTRLLPKELTHAFGIADEQTYDSRAEQRAEPPPAAAADPVEALIDAAAAQAGSNAGGQHKRKAPEQQQSAGMPAASAGNIQQPATSVPQSANVAAAQTASMQAPSTSQQQAVSSISAGLHQAAAAAVVGGQLRGFPAAYISPHTLLPYGQQAVAAVSHLSGTGPACLLHQYVSWHLFRFIACLHSQGHRFPQCNSGAFGTVFPKHTNYSTNMRASNSTARMSRPCTVVSVGPQVRSQWPCTPQQTSQQ